MKQVSRTSSQHLFWQLVFSILLMLGWMTTFFLVSPTAAHAAQRTMTAPTTQRTMAAPTTQRNGTTTILLVHGFAPTNQGNRIDCTASGAQDGFGEVLHYLQNSHPINGQNLTWHRQDFRTIGYYKYDQHCTDNLFKDSSSQNCNGYAGSNESTYGTSNDSIYHVSCELAWYIYDKFGVHGWSLSIIAHSMGGLIVRNMMYQVQNRAALHTGNLFPPTLGNILDVVTLDSPHNGVVGGALTDWLSECSGCRQVKELERGSSFMNEMQKGAQTPSAGNLGATDWTMIDNTCDPVTLGASGTWMDGGRKVFFLAPCYGHEGPLQDESDATDASVHWSNGTPRDTTNWVTWRQAPHSLHYMMYGLWESTW